MADVSNLTDHFLIAMPAMDDPNFARSVVYVCQHDDEGAMGLVINRPASLTVGDILDQLEIAPTSRSVAQQPVLVGGPVQSERGFVLHERDQRQWDSSMAVGADLSVTTSRDILLTFAEGKPPRRQLFVLGYAGWTAGQLDQELLDNAWLTVLADRAVMFETAIDQRWHAATGLLGFDPSQLSGYAGRA